MRIILYKDLSVYLTQKYGRTLFDVYYYVAADFVGGSGIKSWVQNAHMDQVTWTFDGRHLSVARSQRYPYALVISQMISIDIEMRR